MRTLMPVRQKRARCDRCGRPDAHGGSRYLCPRCYRDLGGEEFVPQVREYVALRFGFAVMGVDARGDDR